ncbi:MAG: transketolase [Flavobacteriales bacterium]|jgi:transketolase|nr:transketolase [Flavobacteriales bacterium]|tara:strand:- start:18162 stop:19007 length:846 start_codon:yes stop_codon:yes gene_type:complete
MNKIKELKEICSQVRRDIVRMVHGCQSGHPGGSLGCVEFLVSLYFDIMNHNNKFNMNGENEDIFFLSNGHISPVFYSVLARSGYFPIHELQTFRHINSRLQGHPTTHEKLPGIRIASGSLGQGPSVAIGSALTKKLNSDNSTVYCLCGDGELQEGQIWEAIMYAGAKKVNNLILTIDVNRQQICGSTEEIMSLGDLKMKFTAFEWNVLEVKNGNNIDDVLSILKSAKNLTSDKKPVCILLNTEMGYGVDYMMGSHKWHGIAPNDQQLEIALNQLNETLGDY